MYFLRFRGKPQYQERLDELEAAGYGAGYSTERRSRQKQRAYALRRLTCAFTAMTLLAVAALAFIGIMNERDQVLEKAELFYSSDNACVHFKTNVLQVIVLPNVGLAMVSPKIVSKNLGMIFATETFETPGCVGKTIRRERHSAVAVRYVRIETWPFAISKKSLTLTNEQAVCAQHAMDEFDGTLDCLTES